MFQSVRPNSQVYIFHKNGKYHLDTGYVVNQPIPKPKYPMPTTFGQPQEMVVDLSVKVGEQTFNFNGLPANLDIADSYSNGETLVVATSREAMNTEVLSTKQKSIDIINSVKQNEDIVAQCDAILGILYPEYAEKQNQKEEINTMKDKIDKLTHLVETLLSKTDKL